MEQYSKQSNKLSFYYSIIIAPFVGRLNGVYSRWVGWVPSICTHVRRCRHLSRRDSNERCCVFVCRLTLMATMMMMISFVFRFFFFFFVAGPSLFDFMDAFTHSLEFIKHLVSSRGNFTHANCCLSLPLSPWIKCGSLNSRKNCDSTKFYSNRSHPRALAIAIWNGIRIWMQ